VGKNKKDKKKKRPRNERRLKSKWILTIQKVSPQRALLSLKQEAEHTRRACLGSNDRFVIAEPIDHFLDRLFSLRTEVDAALVCTFPSCVRPGWAPYDFCGNRM